MQPRQYQLENVEALWNYFREKSGNPLCALPTGTGKSVVIALFLQSIFYYYANQKVMILTHVKELIRQNYQKLMTWWPAAPAGVYSAGLNKRDIYHPIIFGGINSVYKIWPAFGKVDLLIVDECDLISPTEDSMYQAFIEGLRSINPALKVIGFTATPWRSGQGMIVGSDKVFTDMCFDITDIQSFNRLISEGFLARLVPKKTELMLDTEGVHIRGGDFIETELALLVDREPITRAAIEETLRLGGDRKKWLLFCSGIDHTENVSEMLNQYGIPCAAIHSKNKNRDKALEDLHTGKLRAVTNNNILTTGYDEPGIDLIVVLRATLSSRLWVQMLGRGTRPFPEKNDCLVLDFARNTPRLGAINDPLIPKKKGMKGGEAPVKLCEACDTYNHASVRVCEYCGTPFPEPKSKLKTSAGTDELVKADLPITEEYKIDYINYSKHEKQGSKPMVRVAYYSGYLRFDEFVCFEHEWNRGGSGARRWWKDRTDQTYPSSTAEALELLQNIRPATHIRVWVNKKPYKEILAHCFDGHGFGKQEIASAPYIEVQQSAPPKEPKPKQPKPSQVDQIIEAFGAANGVQRTPLPPAAFDIEDDDIPF